MNVTHLTVVHQILVFDVISTSNYKHNRLPRIWQNSLLLIIGWSWVWYGELCRSRRESLVIEIFPSSEQVKLLASLLSSKVGQIQDMKGSLFLADNFHIAVAIGHMVFLSILATFLRQKFGFTQRVKFSAIFFSSATPKQLSHNTICLCVPFTADINMADVNRINFLKHLPNLVNTSWLWRIGRRIFWINNRNHRTIKISLFLRKVSGAFAVLATRSLAEDAKSDLFPFWTTLKIFAPFFFFYIYGGGQFNFCKVTITNRCSRNETPLLLWKGPREPTARHDHSNRLH